MDDTFLTIIYFRKTQLNSKHEKRNYRIRHDSVCDVMRFRLFTGIFDENPLFLILASYGQGLAPATASYGLAGPDLA